MKTFFENDQNSTLKRPLNEILSDPPGAISPFENGSSQKQLFFILLQLSLSKLTIFAAPMT